MHYTLAIKSISRTVVILIVIICILFIGLVFFLIYDIEGVFFKFWSLMFILNVVILYPIGSMSKKHKKVGFIQFKDTYLSGNYRGKSFSFHYQTIDKIEIIYKSYEGQPRLTLKGVFYRGGTGNEIKLYVNNKVFIYPIYFSNKRSFDYFKKQLSSIGYLANKLLVIKL